jgi:N-acetylmuramoyl-L-alanine amidase
VAAHRSFPSLPGGTSFGLSKRKHPAHIVAVAAGLFAAQASGAAAPEKVVVHLGGHAVHGVHAAGSDGDAVWAPLSALKYLGITATSSATGETVILSISGQDSATMEAAVTTIHGVSMVALNDCTGLLHGRLARNASGEYTLAARIERVKRTSNALEVATSFEVVFRDDEKLEGGLLCEGAYLDPNRMPGLPAGMHITQIDPVTVRITVDKSAGSLEMARPQHGTRYVALLRPSSVIAQAPAPTLHNPPPDPVKSIAGSTFQKPVIPADPGVRPGSAAPAGLQQPVAQAAHNLKPDPASVAKKAPAVSAIAPPPQAGPPIALPPQSEAERVFTDLPNASNLIGSTLIDTASDAASTARAVARPVDVRSLIFRTDNTTRAEVELETVGRATPSVRYVPGANRLELVIPSGTLKLPDGDSGERQITHPIVTHVGLDKTQSGSVVVQVDTTRVVGYTLNVQDNRVTLDLRVPRNASGALADKLIVVDPGHGGVAGGAVGRGGGVAEALEKNLTLAIALKLRAALEQLGARVVMTRDSDVDIPLYARPRLANTIGADLFISIHNDSSPRANKASGTTTYYHSSDPSSRALAECVQNAVTAVSGLPSRGAQTDTSLYASGLAVLRASTMPAVLCEVAYINNVSDRQHLIDPAFQSRIANAMCEGLRNYVEGRGRGAEPAITPGAQPSAPISVESLSAGAPVGSDGKR